MPSVVIELPDASRCMLPAWMFDPVACAEKTNEAEGQVGLTALRALRALLDAQPSRQVTRQQLEPRSSSTCGDADEAKDAATATTQLDGERGLATTAARDTHEVRRAAESLAAGGRRRRSDKEER